MTKQFSVDDTLKFCFPDDWEVCRYDKEGFTTTFTRKIQSIGSADLLALNKTDKILYIIEAKDYEKPSPKVHAEILEEIKERMVQKMAKQFVGTLTGLVCAKACCNPDFKMFYRALLAVDTRVRFVAFVELGKFKNEKMGAGGPLLNNLMLSLKSTMAPICCNKKVICDIDSLPASYGWSVTRIEQ